MPETTAFPRFDPRRVRSYLLRLPLCTRLLALLIIVFEVVNLLSPGRTFELWASLIPNEVGLSSMYRLNTYPLLHLGPFHFLTNIIAVVPLLERFESEFGTLITLALFSGPFATLPGGLYILLEKFVWRAGSVGIAGASVWVFLLMASESVKTWRANPTFDILGVKVQTWTYPCFVCILVSILFPGWASLTGHACALAIGYLWGLGYIKFLVPSERILRWIEGKLNLLGRLPHYVSVDQKTYGRYGVLPSTSSQRVTNLGAGIHMRGSGQRLGP